MFRVVCKLILATNEIQNATPGKMVYDLMRRDPTEVFKKDEVHTLRTTCNGSRASLRDPRSA